jgi:hypothetical protein
MHDGDIVGPEGKYEAVPLSVQLYCRQAAAGRGEPVSGLSGAPCLVGRGSCRPDPLRLMMSEKPG